MWNIEIFQGVEGFGFIQRKFQPPGQEGARERTQPGSSPCAPPLTESSAADEDALLKIGVSVHLWRYFSIFHVLVLKPCTGGTRSWAAKLQGTAPVPVCPALHTAFVGFFDTLAQQWKHSEESPIAGYFFLIF